MPVALGLAAERAEPAFPVELSGDPLAHVNLDSCRELWLSVIHQAWVDATAPSRVTGPTDILQAIRWFGSEDFRLACELAGVDDVAIMRAYREARARHGLTE